MSAWLSPDEEEQLNKELNDINKRISSKEVTLSPVVAQNLVDWRNRYPKTPMSLLLPTVQGISTGVLSEQEAEKVLNTMTGWMFRTKSQKEDKSIWDTLYGGLKTGIRWALAGQQASNDLFTNMIRAQYKARQDGNYQTTSLLGPVSPFNPEGTVISTEVGSMMANPELVGEGFFISKELNAKKVERQARVGGLIEGKVPTFGRIMASTYLNPNSRPYNILSGFIDFGAAVAIPAVPGLKTIKAVGKEELAKAGFMTLQGLTDVRTGLIRTDRVKDFINSRVGTKTIQRMVDLDSVDKALDAFPTADLTFLRNVAKINNEDAMRNFLKESLGVTDGALGKGPRTIEDINLSSWDTIKRERLLQSESRVAKIMTSLGAKMSGGVVVVAGGSDREKLASLKNVQNYLKTLRIDPNERAKLIDDLAEALIKEDGSMKIAATSIEKIIRKSFKELGVDDQLTNDMMDHWSNFSTEFAQRRSYGQVDDIGTSKDFGGVFPGVVDGKTGLFPQPLNVPMVQSEIQRHALMLPDQRRTRRFASEIGWITGKSGILSPKNQGKLRLPFVIAESITSQLFKPLMLLTGGYATRNMAESLIRMANSDKLPIGPLNPLELVAIASFKKYLGDIEGNSFRGTDPKFLDQWRKFLDGDMPESFAETLIKANQRELADAMSTSMREYGPILDYAKRAKNVDWSFVTRDDGLDRFAEGVAAELALLSSDPATRLIASGKTVDEVFDILMKDPQKKHFKMIENGWKNAPVPMPDGTVANVQYKFFDDNGNIIESAAKDYLRTVSIGVVDATTGGNSILKQIIATGGYVDENNNFIQVLKYDREFNAWDGVPISEYTDDMWSALSRIVKDPDIKLKGTYKRGQKVDVNSEKVNFWRRATNVYFGHLYPKREAYLARSPAWRVFYYQAIGDLLDELAPGEANIILSNIKKFIENEGKVFSRDTAAKYVGSRDLVDRLLKMESGEIPATGKVTHRQLSAYAKGYALDETQRLFFNAAERSNFADALSIIAPFGAAWAEASKYWIKLLGTNPEATKRLSIGYQSLEGLDPDGDGKGMFYKDPNTGEMMFAFPFGNEFAPFILGWTGLVLGGVTAGLGGAALLGAAGYLGGKKMEPDLNKLNVQWSAPLTSLNMSFNVRPPFGPVVQAPAWYLLKDKPEYDQFVQFISPYGKPGFTPSWAEKVWQSIQQNPNTDRIYADLKLEMIRALTATGKFDTNTQQGKLDLEKEAADYAGNLLLLQGLGQLAGPMRPSPDAVVDTKQGDVLAGDLSKIWNEMFRENPDTAPFKFLDTFGDDVFLYMQSKSKTDFGGLEYSKEFNVWQGKNKDLFRKYPEVAGYLAPVGTEYDYNVYLRQRERGMKTPLSGQDFIDAGQFKIGQALYRAAVRRAGPKPNAQQREILKEYRKKLESDFTGFRDARMDINKLDSQINLLYEAVKEPSLDGNPIVDALKTYFEFRDQAIQVAESLGLSGLSGQKMADAREFLRKVGEDLSAQIPEFERLWNRVLFNEVDLFS